MGAYDTACAEHKEKTDSLLRDTKANGGLAPLDIKKFWEDQKKASADPFGADIPQCLFGASLTAECVFDELGVERDDWRFFYGDDGWGQELSKRYNDLAERIVGLRLLNEKPADKSLEWPKIKGLNDIFEAENVWEGGAAGSWWLKQSANSPEELSALLDRVERRLDNLRDFLLPENWESEKKRLTGLGLKVPLYRGQRGPCTFAASVYGAENLLLLYYDDPALMRRFSELIARAVLGRAAVIDDEAGPETVAQSRGWGWADDNCCLFTPEMYESWAMPIHRAVFGKYAAGEGTYRYQHSDSAMGHLLPLLGELDMTGVNFGPTLTVAEIRKHCPRARIDGQLAPFTYSRNEEANMVAEFLRDFDQAKEKRGLNFATAGSINNGSRLSGMRLLMAAIQRYGRY
jgi:uroporphyrinogen decarboxylase